MRVGAFVVPILASFAVTRFVSRVLWHPPGWDGLALFVVQVAVVGSAAAVLSERAIRRVLPLAMLLNMTLVFPDRAPSRFGVALRSGSLKKLQASLDDGLSRDHQAAAERLVGMVTTLGRHERLTRGHTERVRAYSDLIGEQLGLSVEDRHKLSWAAMIHDIGKLTVPAEVLNIPGRPNDEQWAQLKHHPVAGGELVQPLAGWLGQWRLAASQHHERWDGTGYPDGVAGADISLAGRIVAVADAYDVITSNRSYKKAMAAEAAREEMVRCSGTHFDPDVVRALLHASLGAKRTRFGFFGWFTELGGLAIIPRGISQVAATVTTVTVATVATVAGAPSPQPFETAAPVNIPEITVPNELPFHDSDAGPMSDTNNETPTVETPTNDPPATSTTLLAGSTSTSTTSTTLLTGSTSTPTTGDTTGPVSTGTATTTTTVATTTTTATSTTTTSTTTTTTTVPPPPSANWDLGSGGYTTSQNFLPLDGTPQPGLLPNYDTDRDGDRGLLIDKGDGLSETDPDKHQRWSQTMNGDRIAGTPVLNVWAATKDFDTGKTGRFAVGIYDCNTSHTGCTLLVSKNQSFSQSSFGNDYGEVTVTMNPIDHTFATNRTIVIKIATRNASDDDLWFAYETTTYPTNLDIN